MSNFAPTSTPRVGSSSSSTRGDARHGAREHHLLLVAAREMCAPSARVRSPSADAPALFPRPARARRGGRETSAAVEPPKDAAATRCSRCPASSSRPSVRRSRGAEAMPCAPGVGRAPVSSSGTPSSVTRPAARWRRSAPISRSGPASARPAKPRISPLRSSNETSRRPSAAEAPDRKNDGLAGGRRRGPGAPRYPRGRSSARSISPWWRSLAASVARVSPSRSTVIRSAIASTSSSRCET